MIVFVAIICVIILIAIIVFFVYDPDSSVDQSMNVYGGYTTDYSSTQIISDDDNTNSPDIFDGGNITSSGIDDIPGSSTDFDFGGGDSGGGGASGDW